MHMWLCNEDEFDTVRVWNEACPWQHTPMVTKYEGSTVKMSLTQSGFGMNQVWRKHCQDEFDTVMVWNEPSMKEALSRWLWHNIYLCNNAHDIWQTLHCHDKFMVRHTQMLTEALLRWLWHSQVFEVSPWQYTVMHMTYDRHCTVITGLWLGSGLGRLTTALGTLKCWQKHC